MEKKNHTFPTSILNFKDT